MFHQGAVRHPGSSHSHLSVLIFFSSLPVFNTYCYCKIFQHCSLWALELCWRPSATSWGFALMDLLGLFSPSPADFILVVMTVCLVVLRSRCSELSCLCCTALTIQPLLLGIQLLNTKSVGDLLHFKCWNPLKFPHGARGQPCCILGGQ